MLIFKENIYKSGLVDTETYNTELWEIGKSPYKNGLYDTTPYNTPLYGDKIIESETRDEILTLLSRSIVDPSLFAQYDSTTADRPPQPGRCYEFDGVDDQILILNNNETNWVDGIKISAYIKTTSTVGGYANIIFQKNNINTSTQLGYSFYISAGRLTSQRGNGTTFKIITSNLIVNDGNWHKVSLQYLNGNCIFTVDDVSEVISEQGLTGSTANGSGCVIGRSLNIAPFEGELYNVQVEDLNNILALYKCDESAGTTAYDSSGNGNHGTITNATLSTFHATDKDICYSWQNNVGYSTPLVFDGVNDQVSFPAFSLSTDFTIYVKMMATEFNRFIAGSTSGGFNYLQVEGSTFTDIVFVSSGGAFVPVDLGGSYLNKPLSVAIRFTSGDIKAYVDGVNTYTAATAFTVTGNFNNIGRYSTTYFEGVIGEIAFFNSGLSDSELSDLSDGTISPTASADLETYFINSGITDADWVDHSGNGNDGTVQGTPDEVLLPRDESAISKDVSGNPLEFTGKALYNADLAQSNCATFDGVDDYVLTTFSPTSRHSVTMGGWVKPGSDYSVNRMILGGTLAKYYLRFQPTTKQVIFTTVGVKDYIFSYAAIDNVWVHLVVVFNSDFSADLYVNGKFNQKITGVAQATSNTYNLAIGGSPTVWNFLGSLSNIFFAERVLSSTEIKSMYENNIPDNIDFIIPLAEGVGTTAYDVSGNGNHGTATNITESTFWGNKQDVYHYNIKEGMSKYMYFDGVNDYINHPTFLPSGPFSIYLNYTNTINTAGIVALPLGGGGTYMRDYGHRILAFLQGTDQFNGYMDNGTGYGQIVNTVLNFESGNSKTYTFGAQTGTNADTFSGTSLGFGTIGAYSNFFTKGIIFNVAYYDTPLTESEALKLSNKEIEPNDPSIAHKLWGYWKNTGNTNADWVDLSGNGNDGTVNGSPANIYIPAKADKLSDAVNNTILNPAGQWHNGAETKLKYPNTPELQVANDAQGSNWIFDASDVANHISYSDIVANVNNNDYILSDVSVDNKKTGPLIFNPVLPTNELQTLKKHLNH